MSSIPSSAIGNQIVHIARSKVGETAVVVEINEFTIAVEELITKHRLSVSVPAALYVMRTFTEYLEERREWPKELSGT